MIVANGIKVLMHNNGVKLITILDGGLVGFVMPTLNVSMERNVRKVKIFQIYLSILLSIFGNRPSLIFCRVAIFQTNSPNFRRSRVLTPRAGALANEVPSRCKHQRPSQHEHMVFSTNANRNLRVSPLVEENPGIL